MSNPQSASEDQNEIRNASERVVVVAARFALDEYLNYSASICLPNRTFQSCVRMAFYTKNNIDRRIPKILGQLEAISRDEIETRTDLTDSERARLRTLLKKMESAKSEEWGKRKLKLNHERYAEEVAMGLHEKGAKKSKKGGGKKHGNGGKEHVVRGEQGKL